MSNWESLKLHEFLPLHPKVRLVELGSKQVVVEGEYDLNAQMNGFEPIHMSFRLQMVFPADYPRVLPVVKELDCLLYTSPSPRDLSTSRMPSSA